MSLNRMILRSLVCNALMTPDGAAWQTTMADNNHVFDSRLDPVQFTVNEAAVPAVVVYTDDDDAVLQNHSSNNGPYTRHVDLRIEIAITSFDSVTYVEDEKTKKGIAQSLPTTDPELEAKLDLFEQQVRWALRLNMNDATRALNAFVVQFGHISSTPHRDEGGNNRLAMRRIIQRVRINDDCPPPYRLDDVEAPISTDLLPDDFPVSDWLKEMLVAMQKSPSMRNVVEVLGGNTSTAVVIPLLKRISASVDCIWPADPALLANLNRDKGPDGRVEHFALWEL